MVTHNDSKLIFQSLVFSVITFVKGVEELIMKSQFNP